MNEHDHLQTLSEIRTLMERSSRFLSLSGFSGIFIGFYALFGAYAASWHLKSNIAAESNYEKLATGSEFEKYLPYLNFMNVDAALVLILSVITAYVFTQRLAKKQGLHKWDASAKRLLINLLVPLCSGGIFCLILLHHHYIGLIAPSMLIFYGLSLLNSSKYTHSEIRYLGLAEIILGLIAAFFIGHGLLLWAIGFGVFHIVFGITMYFKYER
ncbi:MAG: hypothetical protein ACOYOA_13785 [Saprospiraceae bacterium]